MHAFETPRSSTDTEPYWQAAQRGTLLFQRCRSCGEPVFHPRPLCPYCLSDDMAWEASSGRGEIYSFTLQRVPLVASEQPWSPIALGIVALAEGYHMFSEIAFTSAAELAIGRPVEVWFDDRGNGVVLPKFKVVRCAI